MLLKQRILKTRYTSFYWFRLVYNWEWIRKITLNVMNYTLKIPPIFMLIIGVAYKQNIY